MGKFPGISEEGYQLHNSGSAYQRSQKSQVRITNREQPFDPKQTAEQRQTRSMNMSSELST